MLVWTCAVFSLVMEKELDAKFALESVFVETVVVVSKSPFVLYSSPLLLIVPAAV